MSEHPVTDIIEAVEATHPGLGRLAAFTAVCAKARKCLITVAPPGCGKSKIGEWLQKVHPEAYVKQSITRSALKIYEEQFNGFRGCVIMDDVGAIDTKWSRMQTLVTMAEITYGGFVSKDSHQLHIEIDDFKGSSILNIQPNILKEVVEDPSWHSNLADKSLRYYHLRRATSPNKAVPNAPLDWGLDLDEVDILPEENATWQAVLQIGMEQWTYPRAVEHCGDLIRAVAALGSNPYPGQMDMDILLDLMRPMTVEMEILERGGFGSKATLNDNLLYVLVEFASYPVLTYGLIARDYHFRETKVVEILSRMHEWFDKIGTNPVQLQPSERMVTLLVKAGIR